jgi:two-component system, OmpR family, sensor kinase
MDPARTALPERLLDTLERLLALPAGDIRATLTHVCNVLADATGCDKVDAFLYDAGRDSLVAVGNSTQPLSALQRRLGLDVLPLSNGGRAVEAYRTGQAARLGRVEDDPIELKGIKEALGVRSLVAMPLDVGAKRRGALMLTSRTHDFFTEDDARFVAAAGRWVGIVAHHAELTAEIGRSAEERGRRAGAEELVTVVAHDLRNYITPIATRLEILRLRAAQAGRDEDLEDIAALGASVTRLGGLVNEVLDVARIDRGIYHMAQESLDIGALVRRVIEGFSTAAHVVHLRVQDGDPIRVSGDAPRLHQCIGNLVANALQKSPADAPVSVFVTSGSSHDGKPVARVEVIDQGPGIPEDVLPHVFERFYTGRRSEGGLGIGLYLGKRIALQHGGDLTVESRPGAGARFSLILPALGAPTGSR